MIMATKIEWADETWNPVTGCTKVSAGCAHCYAERMAKRLRGRYGYPADDPFRVTVHDDKIVTPLAWRKPRRVFVCSMGDLFHPDIEIVDSSVIRDVFAVMALCQQHTFQVLTKRPEVAKAMLTDDFAESVYWAADAIAEDYQYRVGEIATAWPLPNVWIGVSAEDQAATDERIPILLHIPAAVRFVSIEPMLGPVLLDDGCNSWLTCDGRNREANEGECCEAYAMIGECFDGIDWVIVGGETGPGARPMKPEWARSVRDQCREAGIPYFFKSWGEWYPNDERCPGFAEMEIDARHTSVGDMAFARVGKKRAGRLLDGREWNQFPEEIEP